MNSYDLFIAFIFLIKIIFVICAIWHAILVERNKANTKLAKKLVYWKERCEFIFIVSMSILCIYLFFPLWTKTVPINHETRVLLFIFGIIILITSDWGLFFKQSKWFSTLQTIVGGGSVKK